MAVDLNTALSQQLSNVDQLGQQSSDNTTMLRQLATRQQQIQAANAQTNQYKSMLANIPQYNFSLPGIKSTVTGGGSVSSSSSSSGSNGNGLDAFLKALRGQESGGNYSARGVPTNGGRAEGAYQVMDANIPSWTKQALGHSVSVSQYLASPAIQDAVAKKIAGSYYSDLGAGGAAAAWYGGLGAGKAYASGVRNTKSQYGGPSIADYVSSVLKRM